MKTKPRKKWWTLAWLTREGQPCPAHRHDNFSQVYKDERVLLADLSHGMTHFNPHGAYVAAAWEGQVTEERAMKVQRPKFYVWEDGSAHVLT